MDLPVIGAHCSLPTCKDLDLLPIRCRCDNLFCRHHILPENHDCAVDLNPAAGVPFEKLKRCAAEKCNKPSLESFIGSPSDEIGRSPATCPHCRKAFCVRLVDDKLASLNETIIDCPTQPSPSWIPLMSSTENSAVD